MLNIYILFCLLLCFYCSFNINKRKIRGYIYNKPNSGGLGNKLLGVSSSLIIALFTDRRLICIYNYIFDSI